MGVVGTDLSGHLAARWLMVFSTLRADTRDLDLLPLMRRIVPAMFALVPGVLLVLASESNLSRLLGLVLAGAPFLLMEVFYLKRAVLALMILEIPFALDVYLNHEIDPDRFTTLTTLNPDHINALAGVNISLTTFGLILLFTLWAAEALASDRKGSGDRYKCLVPAFAYVGAMGLSVLVVRSVSLAMFEIAIVVQALLLLVYVVHLVTTRRDVLFFVLVLVVGLIVQSLVVLAQASFGFAIDAPPIATYEWGNRMAGTIGSPGALGSYLGLVLGLALGLALAQVNIVYRAIGVTALVLGGASMYLTYSRGGWVGFAVSCGVVAWVAYKERWISRTVIVGVALGCSLALAVAFGGAIVERLTTGSTVDTRVDLMRIALSVIRDNPVLGVGANNFAASIDPYVTVDFSRQWVSTVHNKYLLVWAETGLVGLAAFLWIMVSALRRAWSVVAGGDRFLSPVMLGLSVGIVANLLHMFVEIFHSRPQTQMLWVQIGLVLALANMANSERTASQGRLSHAWS